VKKLKKSVIFIAFNKKKFNFTIFFLVFAYKNNQKFKDFQKKSMFPTLKPLIFLIFLLTPSLAAVNSSFFYEVVLKDHNYKIHKNQITALNLPYEFQPIYHLDLTNSDGNKEHSCAVFQRKLEFFSDQNFPLEKSLENAEYDKLLLLDRKLLLILDDNSMLYHYSFDHENVSLINSFDLTSFFNGSSQGKSSKKLVFLNESQSFLAITEEKALGFKSLSDLSQNSLHEDYRAINKLYTAKIMKNYLFIAGGSSGVMIYDISSGKLLLKKQLSSEIGVFTIYDARDLSISGNTLLILDKKAGILFFSLEKLEYLGTNIAFMNGESFVHRGLEVFYISGSEGSRFFAYEILYFKEKSFRINKKSDEILPIKHMEIFENYVFILTGETMKILYHSIPTEWLPARFNLVNHIAEKGLKNFMAFEENSFNHLIGFTNGKIVVMKVKEIQPQIYCGYGDENTREYAYTLTIFSRNCPLKDLNAPYYSLCRITQKIMVKIYDNDLIAINYDHITVGIIVILTVCLVVALVFMGFFFWRSRKEVGKMQVEMEGIKRKYKYQEINEEKRHSRDPSQDLSNVV